MNKERIEQAYAAGTLFTYMPECKDFLTNPAFSKLLDVMAGKPETSYAAQMQRVIARKEGFAGLPTTALKKGFPTMVFGLMSRSGGLLIDGEDQEVKVLLITPQDARSKFRDSVKAEENTIETSFSFTVHSSPTDTQYIEEISNTQGISAGKLNSEITLHFSDLNMFASERNLLARKALALMWDLLFNEPQFGESLKKNRLFNFFEGDHLLPHNEAVLIAKVTSICGVISASPSLLDFENDPMADPSSFIVTLGQKRRLEKDFPAIFPSNDSLPLMWLDLSKTDGNCLTEIALTPERIQKARDSLKNVRYFPSTALFKAILENESKRNFERS